MASKKSKATKKFEKNRLKDTIDRRKDFAKVKQRHKLKEKRTKAKGSGNSPSRDLDNVSGKQNDKIGAKDVDGDQYFQNEIQIPESGGKVAITKALKTDIPPQTGKRKRVAKVNDDALSEKILSDEQQSDFSEHDSTDGGGEVHKDELDALAQKDPEFYKYLKENDAELLHFEENGDLAGVDALSDDEVEDGGRPIKKQKKGGAGGEDEEESKVSIATIKKWKASMSEQHSIRALRQVVLAFRAAAHVNNEDQQDSRYTIADSEVYHQVLVTALKGVGPVLNHHLPAKETAAGKLHVPTDSKKFKTLAPLIKSHASSIHHILQDLSDTPTLRLTLQSFEPLLPYLLQFRKLLKPIIKIISSTWSNNSHLETVRISAFLILRRLMVLGDPGIRETILKSAYEGIVRGSRNTTVHTLPGINLMKNSAAEIWAIDAKVGYATGFTSIRQLAIHLRSNMTKPTKGSYKTIYNWQFIHSLDFWSRVLSMHCNPLAEIQATTTARTSAFTSAAKGTAKGKAKADGSPLRPLIYPLVHLSLGTLRLLPSTPAYFPLHFHIIRSLLRLASSTDTFIPLAPSLLEVLNSTEMKKPPRPATLKPLEFEVTLKAPAGYPRTRVYQDGVGEQTIELMGEFFVQWCKSIAFPELQLPVTVMLKRWLRSVSHSSSSGGGSKGGGGNKNIKIQRQISLLIQKLEANARWIEERRNQVSFSPRDRTEVEAFLKDVEWEATPLGAFVQGQRRGREERRRILEEGVYGEEGEGGKSVGQRLGQAQGQEELDEELVDGDEEVEETDEDEGEDDDEEENDGTEG